MPLGLRKLGNSECGGKVCLCGKVKLELAQEGLPKIHISRHNELGSKMVLKLGFLEAKAILFLRLAKFVGMK